MGRIKSMAIKRAAKALFSQSNEFTTDFEKNKILLKNQNLPDKGTRNKIAGYLVRLKKIESNTKSKLSE
ncbi:MAG: 30S ribosomal protein S17e [Candidatus Pacearchaeota archaeon]